MRRILSASLFFLFALNLLAQRSKMSPYVRMVAMQEHTAATRAKAKGGQHHVAAITAFVRSDSEELLRQEGCRIYAQWDDVFIASIPLDRLDRLASMPQIQRIEAGRSCSITNDTTAIITRAKELWEGSYAHSLDNVKLDGKGVVVGVMDVGFDLTHPTFYSADMKDYRIKALWDQLDFSTGGEPVTGPKDTIYLGRQYIGKEALLGKQTSADGLILTHGTHTTGTATGTGAPMLMPEGKAVYSGMAPGADICLVANNASDNSELIPEEQRKLYTTATDMLGFKYIFDYAESVGKPCVINFSEGSYDDLYESGIYQEVLGKMVGPGRILCAAAGNEGWKGSFMEKPKGMERAGAFLKADSKYAIYELCSENPVKVKLTFYPTNKETVEWTYDAEGLREYPDSVMEDSLIVDGVKYRILMCAYPSCYDENLIATDFVLIDLQDKSFSTSHQPVSLTLLGKDNDIKAYGAGGNFMTSTKDPSLDDFTNDHNILFPGSLDGVICVGNSAYRTVFLNHEDKWRAPFGTSETNGVISVYSSKGPAISGRMKPDVCAPGMNVLSSINSFFRENLPTKAIDDDVCYTEYNGRLYPWAAESGTSMASPCVTGIVAMWLQICPTLTPAQVLETLANSSSHSDKSLDYPNPSYGYGLVDAVAGIDYIMNTFCGIEELKDTDSSDDKNSNYYDLYGRRIKDINCYHGIYVTNKSKYIKR